MKKGLGFTPYVLDCGKYMRKCADCGKTLDEVRELFESILNVDDLCLTETLFLADFIGVTRATLLADYVY